MTVVDARLVEDVRRRMVAERATPTAATLAGAAVDAGAFGGAAVLGLSAALGDELVGLGPLGPLLADPGVTDVLVNAPDEVWVDRGAGLQSASGVAFADDLAVRRLACRLALRGGRRLDDAQPFADVRLPGGVRLHAVLGPVVSPTTLISLRIPPRETFSVAALVSTGTLTTELAEMLVALVRARVSFLVTGGTGSGKTTLLSTLLGACDPGERVVLVEEIGELRPALAHVVRLRTREPNSEGFGAVGLAALVRETLRMRPDRVVVGEVRGAEVVDLFRAFNTGHEGGCATLHANSPSEVPARIEAFGLLAGIGRPAAHSLLAAAVEAVVHVSRLPDGRRLVTEVAVTRRDSSGLVRLVPAWRRDRLPGGGEGSARLAALLERGGRRLVA